jgi:hypothetical protein
MALYNNLGFNIKETSDKNIEHFVEHKTLHIISYNIAVSCDTQSIFFLFKSDYLSSMGFFFFFFLQFLEIRASNKHSFQGKFRI